MIIMKLVIPVTKVALGHQPHTSGSGVHRDKRLKREHTRSQQKLAVKKIDTKY